MSRKVKLILMLVFVCTLVACSEASSSADAKVKAAQAEVKEAVVVSDKEMKSLIEKISASRPDIEITEVEKTQLEDIYRAKVKDRGDIYLVGNEGHFFVGDLYKAESVGLVNLSEKLRSKDRYKLISSVERKDAIVFSPKGEVKQSISIFTDVDCGYCAKIHAEVPQLNEMGIEVKYLAFPRAGIGSESYKKIASAWCADDKQDALTKLKKRQSIPTNVCKENPVAAQYALGQKLGVTGTPSIILDSGEMLPGYMPAKDLAARIGL